ncbi:RagB/SusD family nutrient uptake outer membrane protein [Pontibacter silvestris]|uniref:RagB/SusD family nutrient uptake outer membrane protein n=1 Tax=Pontibacter silvestris TaxID=2305183 RepID=A0ABW4WXP8_9BACT|nr:RagB/SusD family nutrient uptake outer membrane protein [Pontibacter silvestris]MCC9135358.1 RagB/SusD family nutrient uptake outer membrane protein [Pontibacter silvestris]
MKKIFRYILVFAISGMAMSCEETLDIENPNEISEQNYWQTQSDALAGVNAIYGAFYRNGTYARWLQIYYNPRSDDGFASTGWAELRNAINFNQVDYNFEGHRNIWDHQYRAIFRANQVLAYVPDIEMDETLKQRYLAEAKFLRALHYFNLVSLFRSVPLVLDPSNPTDLPSQAPESETWAQIERDLTEAAPNLPTSYDSENLGRATRGAAYALLGKAYLQQHEYQQAADAFSWLVEGEGSSYYDLTPNYRENFLHTTENNPESVFEVQFLSVQSTTDEDAPTSNLGNQRGPFFGPGNGAGFNDVEMRRWVIDEFLEETTVNGERDPRLASTALYSHTDERGPEFSTFYGRTFAELVGPDDQRVWYRKYLNDYFRTDETYEGPINFRVIRYADVLLMYAECLNALNRTNEAYQYVDRVRQRAGLASLSAVKPNLSQEAFLQQLMHERVTELTGESVRWLDLLRWGYLDDPAKVEELQARDPEFNDYDINRDKWLPIPQSELDINPNLQQNW